MIDTDFAGSVQQVLQEICIDARIFLAGIGRPWRQRRNVSQRLVRYDRYGLRLFRFLGLRLFLAGLGFWWLELQGFRHFDSLRLCGWHFTRFSRRLVDDAEFLFGFGREFCRHGLGVDVRLGNDFGSRRFDRGQISGVQGVNPFLEVLGGRDLLAGDHHVAHAVQFVDTTLQQIIYLRIRRNLVVVDIDQERLEFVTQVTHRQDAGHARAALERVQVAFELLHVLARRPVLCPFAQRLVRRLQEFSGLLGKNRCNLGVVFGFLSRRVCSFVELFHGDGRHRLCLIGRWFDLVRQIPQVFDQYREILARAIGLVDVADNRVDRRSRGAQDLDRRFRKSCFHLVDVAHVTIKRARDSHTPVDIGHVRAAVQCMAGTVQLVGYMKRGLVSLAGIQVIIDDRQVNRCFLGENIE